MRSLSLRRALATLSVAVVASAGLAVATAGPANATVGSYDNGDIATKALTYVGQWGGNACRDAGKLDSNGTTVGGYGAGQCRTFVNCVLYLVSGGTQYPTGTDYFTSFLNAGADEITKVNDLVRGDIVQIGQGTHTTIIVDRRADGTFDVVDSNYYQTQPEVVTTHTYSVVLGPNERAFRMGTVGAAATNYVNRRLVGDFNGDGKADAMVMFGQHGNAKVALSNGSQFGYPGDWSYGQSQGLTDYATADVNGDGMSDLIAYDGTNRKWFVSLSSGSGFWSPTEWAYDGSLVPDRTFFADVNGDGKADKIFYIGGTWYVGLSSGTGFWTPTVWITGHGVGANNVLVGDFNGDGLADAAIWFASNGNWYVALSNGSNQFNYPGLWCAACGMSAKFAINGDANGDGKSDIAYYGDNPYYKWWISPSTGSVFASAPEWSYDGPTYNAMDNAWLADVNGDGKADKVEFFDNTGNWYAATSSGSGFWPLSQWISGHGAGS